jgi:ribonuclease P protein component
VFQVKLIESLKKNCEFRYVYSKGKPISNRLLVMYVLPNGMGFNRLGITVSKKVGNSVVRNKVTRRIRESYRLADAKPAKGNDIIIVARTGTSTATYAGIDKALRQLLKKQGIGGA